jgi:hypothetical protein
VKISSRSGHSFALDLDEWSKDSWINPLKKSTVKRLGPLSYSRASKIAVVKSLVSGRPAWLEKPAPTMKTVLIFAPFILRSF